jgi:hypothetical protein
MSLQRADNSLSRLLFDGTRHVCWRISSCIVGRKLGVEFRSTAMAEIALCDETVSLSSVSAAPASRTWIACSVRFIT